MKMTVSTPTKDKIILIDGSSFIFRAFYAIRELTSPEGLPTNAIYGVVSMLKQIIKRYDTPYICCVFDAPGKTFRDDLYPEYKANRRKTPEELIVQFPYIYEVVKSLGFPVIIQDGVEADDVIGTLANHFAGIGYDIIIATGDKDFAQLVNDKITLLNTMTNEILDISGVVAKFGVKPKQIIDYLSLIGDTVDNVKGVEKCGPKTAVKWLTEYDNIDNLILNKHKIAGVVGANLAKAVDFLPLARELITIKTDVEIVANMGLDVISLQPANDSKLFELYQKFNFRTWLKELDSKLILSVNNDLLEPIVNNITLVDDIVIIKNPQELQAIINDILDNKKNTGFNIYLEDIKNNSGSIASLIISDTDKCYIVNLLASVGNDLFIEINSDYDAYLAIMQSYLSSDTYKICYNLKSLQHVLKTYNITLNSNLDDLALASYVSCSNEKNDLINLNNRFLNLEMLDLSDSLTKSFSWYNCSEQQLISIAKTSANFINLFDCITNQLSEVEFNLYKNIELPIAHILFKMEDIGIKINKTLFNELAIELTNRLKELEEHIYQTSGLVFNINSPKQLQDVLYGSLKLSTTGVKKIASGFSTDEEALNILMEQGHLIAKLLLEYRYLNKLFSTYVSKLPDLTDSNDALHTTFEQFVVMSGRLSSKNPNLQNIPVQNHYGNVIRSCFIAREGYQFICADYSQIELRVLAQISQDENLINAFKQNLDIHLITASQIFHKDVELVTKEERRYAKSINFGLIYGKSVFGLAKELNISRVEAKEYIERYFARFPNVAKYMQKVKTSASHKGYVETLYGRRIYLKNINSSNAILRSADERVALNAPMQGSAADIIKVAMIKLDQWLNANSLNSRVILQVHDELIIEALESESNLIYTKLAEIMTDQNIQLDVPLSVDIKIAANWLEAH